MHLRPLYSGILGLFLLLLGSVGLSAQIGMPEVPLELKVENVYTQRGVRKAKVTIYRKEVTYDGDRIRTRVRTLYSDTAGYVRIDLAPNYTYLIATEKEDFYRSHTPVTLPKYPKKGVVTRLSLSLRPQNYQRVQFSFAWEEEAALPGGLELALTRRETREQFHWPISSRGMVSLHLPIRSTFDVKVKGEGIAPFHDSLRLWAPSEGGIVIQKNYRLHPPAFPWEQGDTLLRNPIEFDGRSAELLDSCWAKMDELRSLLERYPQLAVVIEVYTDARGDAAKNQALSEARIAGLQAYMADWAVDAQRIRFEAKGDQNLLNDCKKEVPCTEAEHQINNRLLVWVRSAQ